MAESSSSGEQVIGGQTFNAAQGRHERERNLAEELSATQGPSGSVMNHHQTSHVSQDSEHGGVNLEQSVNKANANDINRPYSSHHPPLPGRFGNTNRPAPRFFLQPILDPMAPAARTPLVYHYQQMAESRENAGRRTPFYDTIQGLQRENGLGSACKGHRLLEEVSIDPINKPLFDERWINHPEQMWNTGSRRTSCLTISPHDILANENNIIHQTLVDRPNRVRYLESIAARARARNQRKRENLATVRTEREHNITGRVLSSQTSSAVDNLCANLPDQRIGKNLFSAGAPWTMGRGRRELGASDWTLADWRGDIGLAHRDLGVSVAETSHNIEATTDNLEGITDKPECTADSFEGSANNLGERNTMIGSAAVRQVMDEISQDVERRSFGLPLDAIRDTTMVDTTRAHTAGRAQEPQNTLTVSARNASEIHQGPGHARVPSITLQSPNSVRGQLMDSHMSGNVASGDTQTSMPTNNQPTPRTSQFLRYMKPSSFQQHGAEHNLHTSTNYLSLRDMPSSSSQVYGAANNHNTTTSTRDLAHSAVENHPMISGSPNLRNLSSSNSQVHEASNNQYTTTSTQTLGNMASGPPYVNGAANNQHATTRNQTLSNMVPSSSQLYDVANHQRTTTDTQTLSNMAPCNSQSYGAANVQHVPTDTQIFSSMVPPSSQLHFAAINPRTTASTQTSINPASSNLQSHFAMPNQSTSTSNQTSSNIALSNLQAHIAAHNQAVGVDTQISSNVSGSGSRTQVVSHNPSESSGASSTLVPPNRTTRRSRNSKATRNQSAASGSHTTTQANAGPSCFSGHNGQIPTTPWTSSITMEPFMATDPVRGAPSPSLLAFNANQLATGRLPDFRRFPMQLTPDEIAEALSEQQQLNQIQYGPGSPQEDDSQLHPGAQQPSVHQSQPAAQQHAGALQLPRNQQPRAAQRPKPVFLSQPLGPQGYHPQLTATPYGLPVPSVSPPFGAPPTVSWYHQYAPAGASAQLAGPAVFNTAWSNTIGQPASHHGAGAPVLNPLPYRAGQSAMYPQPAVAGTSVRLQLMTRGGSPSYEMAMGTGFLPFQQTAWEAAPVGWGVVRVTNIPYSITKQEVLAFLGRNAKIITPDLGCPIHITMERTTGKTMDCYIEFFSFGDAQAAISRLQHGRDFEGRGLRLGDRHVEVSLCSQAELMEAMFPKAKNVEWHMQVPMVLEETDPFLTGFTGFLTGEELVMMVKYAEQPHRFGFSQKCLNRTYECMISTLYKFPWFATPLYTLAQRNQIYAALLSQLTALSNAVMLGGARGLTEPLLQELLYAGLNVPAFSEKQRCALVDATAGMAVVNVGLKISPLMRHWPFEVLGRKQEWDEDVVEFYADMLCYASTGVDPASNPNHSYGPFGTMDLTNDPSWTIERVGAVEWDILNGIVGGALRRDEEWE